MDDKAVTTCASMLVAFFNKQKQKKQGRCSCLCHTYKKKNRNSTQLTEMNDNKFFNCKCNHDCERKCMKCEKQLLKKKKRKTSKTTRLDIEHTGSMNNLVSPNRPAVTAVGSCDKLRNTLSFCAHFNGKPRTDSVNSPLHIENCKFRSFTNQFGEDFGSPFATRMPKWKMEKNSQEDPRPKSFYEWTIPYEKIELGEMEATSSKGPVHRARWHGEVMFYTRSHETPEEIDDFHEEVRLLGLIRHENVVLFMGACIQPPNLAVVTSVRKGYTLHTHLHLRLTSFHFGSKFSIAKQVAQGMGYLHAKGINLGKLCSRNIFLESKVKIGITDYTMANPPLVKKQFGCIPKGHLTYLSPELMKSLRVCNRYLLSTQKPTGKSDVFAYGTLVYEIFLGRFPFAGVSPESIIWRIAKGKMPSLDDTDFPISFKGLIQSCWSSNEYKRPEFHEVLTNMKKFNIPRSLQKKLSLSDSGAINKQHSLNSPFHRLNGSPSQRVKWKIDTKEGL